jgi:hypothetical protein
MAHPITVCSLASDPKKKPLPTSKGEKQTKENNKMHADVLELYLIIKMALINGKGLELTN